MPVDVKIIVTDAPPLIILAAAKSLDYLLYPTLPVIIPDAVFFEATNAAGKLGAQEILDWYRDHLDAVRVEPTEAFAIAQLAARAGRRQRDLGERASLEIIRNYPFAQNERALLLSDDRDIGRVIVGRPRPPHPAHHMGLSAPA